MKKGSWSVVLIAFIISVFVVGFSLYEVIDNSHNKLITVTVDYGFDAQEVKTLKLGETIVIDKSPEKDGYIFEGWYVDAEMTTQFDFSQKVKDNISIYAKWTKI